MLLSSRITNLVKRQVGAYYVQNNVPTVSTLLQKAKPTPSNGRAITTLSITCNKSKSSSIIHKQQIHNSSLKSFTTSNIYDMDETNKSISQKENERIKIELSNHTGSDEEYQKLINESKIEEDKLSSMLQNENENSYNNDDEEKEIIIIKQMQKVAMLHWNIGNLDQVFSYQKDILHRQIQFYSKDHQQQQQHNDDDDNGIPQHMDIASTLHFFGSIQSRLHELDDAKKWFDASLKMKQYLLCNVLGYEHHYELGKTYNGLAIVGLQSSYEDSNSVLEVIRLFELAEMNYIHHGEREDDDDQIMDDPPDMEDGYLGDSMADHPNVASINENMAMLYRKHGDFPMALQKYKEALRKRILWIPTDQLESVGDPNVVNLKMDIGDCFKAIEQHQQALDEYEEALRLHLLVIRRMRRNQRHENDSESLISPMEGILRHNIGNMHAQLGRHQVAMEEYQSSLKIKREIDKYSPEIALTLNAIGALKATLGQYDTALAYFNEALYVLRTHSSMFRMGGEDDEHIAQTKKNIELVEKQMGGNFSKF